MTYPVTLIPGDGIGPEVAQAAREVVEATGVEIEWLVCEAGAGAIAAHGDPLPQETLDSIRQTRVALKGPVATPIGEGFRSVNVRLRQELDLYANFRPARTLPGVKSRYENVDLIVVRENTEGLYCGHEHQIAPGVVESLRIVTEQASERIARFAFEIARRHGRRKVTIVHKANILKLGDGLFLRTARRVAADYPEIVCNDSIVDAAAMRLVLDPGQFDVLVMENLFGDIVSDLASGLVGGLGVAPSANVGLDAAVFEAVHGTAPDIAGQGKANPTALVLSAALMLRHLGESAAASAVEHAVLRVLAEGASLTPDLGGRASTHDYTRALIAALEPAAAVV
jgi:isocitrate dehydrogenase (NAD+)